MPGEGPVPCDILFYGEAPGANEESQNRPFVGDAGSILDEVLSMAGVGRSAVHIGNVIRCRPPGNRDPKADEVAACRIFTVQELQAVRPKVIVTLGGVALEALTGRKGIKDNRGQLIPLLPEYRSTIPVIPSYHPASILHQPSVRETRRQQIAADIQLAQKAIAGGTFKAKIAPPLDREKSLRVLGLLKGCDLLACDCEWEVPGGLKSAWPWTRHNGSAPRLISVALAGRRGGEIISCAVPAEDETLFGLVASLLASTSSTYHNASADLIWLLAHGVNPQLAGDTLIIASLLNIDSSLKLKVLAPMLTRVPPGWELGEGLGRMPVTREEWRETLIYNARDAVATLLLNDALLERAASEGNRVIPLYQEILLKVTPYLARAAIAGVPLDEKLLKDLELRAEGDLQAVTARVKETTGATRQEDVGLAVERLAGITLPRTAKTDRPSLAEKALAPYADKHPVVNDLLRVAKVKKLKGTYLTPWRELLEEQGDHRLHSIYSLTHARTGRSSAEGERGGTTQQFPRAVRNLLRARDGWKIVAADESQIELRFAAWVANERRMLSFFEQGIDIHKATASWIKALKQSLTLKQWEAEMGAWIASVTGDERQAAKATNFGFLYGMQEQTFIEQARKEYGITFTLPEAATARTGFFTLYPDLVTWHDDSWKWVRLGYVDTVTGRRRPLDDEDDLALHRKAINTQVQGPASDLSLMGTAQACIEIEENGLFETSVLFIGFSHDESLFEVWDDAVATAQEIVKRHMEHPHLEKLGIDFTVPLEVEVKVAQTWAG